LRLILLGRGGRVGETNRYFCTKNLSAVCDFFLNICDAVPIKAFMLPTFSGCLMGKMGAQLKNAGDAVKTHIASFWLMFGHGMVSCRAAEWVALCTKREQVEAVKPLVLS
jgi:hypothetical protein